jgi:hypothetical protein
MFERPPSTEIFNYLYNLRSPVNPKTPFMLQENMNEINRVFDGIVQRKMELTSSSQAESLHQCSLFVIPLAYIITPTFWFRNST